MTEREYLLRELLNAGLVRISGEPEFIRVSTSSFLSLFSGEEIDMLQMVEEIMNAWGEVHIS